MSGRVLLSGEVLCERGRSVALAPALAKQEANVCIRVCTLGRKQMALRSPAS